MPTLVKMINFKQTEKEFLIMMMMMTFLVIRKKLNEKNKSKLFDNLFNWIEKQKERNLAKKQ